MARISNKSGKLKMVVYWTATGFLTIGMLSGGIAQLIGVAANAEGMTRLGYPLCLMTILGTWKIAGAVALLIPWNPVLKEWAYAGFLFFTTGAIISHLANGDRAAEIAAPLIFAILTIVAWSLRPSNRKIIIFPCLKVNRKNG